MSKETKVPRSNLPKKDFPIEANSPLLKSFTNHFKLTKSESQITTLLCEGLDTKAISEKRSVSVETVRKQIKTIMAKLGVNTRHAIVAKVYKYQD